MPDHMGPSYKAERALQEMGEDMLVEAEKNCRKIQKDLKDGKLDISLAELAGLNGDTLYHIVCARMIAATEGKANLIALRD